MSFASNRSPVKLSGITRGKVVIAGGLKQGGFSIYGSTSRRPNQTKWFDLDQVQSEIRETQRAAERAHTKYTTMQSDLDLRRAIRKKSGKLEDTEGMKLKQAQIDRYVSSLDEDAHRVSQQLTEGQMLARIGVALISVALVVTPLWFVTVFVWGMLFRNLTR